MSDLSTLAPVPLASATDQVFDALYEAIVSFELSPGTKVSEIEVARQLGVSRQPVRDAFFRLSRQGFLVIRPQRATLISKISERAVLQAVFVRTALEVACIRVAVTKVSEAELEGLRTLLHEQRSAVDRDASADFHRLDEAFHQRLCEIAGHGHVWTLIREQKAHMDRIRFLSLPRDARLAHDEHVQVVEALAERDGDRAERELRRHLGRLSSLVSSLRAAHGQYFEAEPSR